LDSLVKQNAGSFVEPSSEKETCLNVTGQRRTFAVPVSIAVQAFNKADSILRTLDSIARSSGSDQYHLVILQDGCSRSNETEKYRAAWAQTTQALEAWISTNTDHFLSVRFDRSKENNGPYRTAERLISQALENSESVIFSEDDVIFERDAMEWFERALVHPMFLRPNVWAIAGESRFFDSNRHSPSDADVCRALEMAETRNLIDRFVYLDFLPSSCFATTRDKWTEFGDTRGTIRGDRAVVDRCLAEGKVCVWPVIARCRDIGMHHPLGYSVRWKGLRHAGFKNSYIVSGMLNGASTELSELTCEKDALLTQFTVFWEELES
jgi:GR25 family glycosyltransferase involved in LPS biosynthesis